MKKLVILACLIASVAPVAAQAQSSRNVQRENRAESRDVDDRMGRTIAAVTAAESQGTVSHGRADELRDMIDRMRSDYSRNKEDQGFVSAAELASYNRSLDDVEREISPRRQNRAASRDVDDRMGRTIAAVTTAESRGRVSHRRADEIRDIIDRMRSDYSRNKDEQGFVSAGELASYNRSLDKVDREISRR